MTSHVRSLVGSKNFNPTFWRLGLQKRDLSRLMLLHILLVLNSSLRVIRLQCISQQLSLPGMWVRSLVRELRFHKSQSIAIKKEKVKTGYQIWLSPPHDQFSDLILH